MFLGRSRLLADSCDLLSKELVFFPIKHEADFKKKTAHVPKDRLDSILGKGKTPAEREDFMRKNGGPDGR